MRSGCGMSAMAELPEGQTGRQLQLVWDTGATAVQCESGARGSGPGARGDGYGARSLAAYVSSLEPGDRCFCCGGRLAEGLSQGGGETLTCKLCGAEVLRSQED